MNRNGPGFEKAASLIDAHQYVLDSDWSAAQPSPDDENDFLDRHGWDEYGRWFLAVDTDASDETKDRYNYPHGDFRRVHRSGLMAAKQRAAQYDDADIEQAADELLERLDDSRAG